MTFLRQLYEETILDHNRNPRNYLKVPEDANRHARGFNPICNDEFTVHLRVKDGIVEDVGFEGSGCAISTASASMMTESIKGKTESEVLALFHGVHNLLTEEGPAEGRGQTVGPGRRPRIPDAHQMRHPAHGILCMRR